MLSCAVVFAVFVFCGFFLFVNCCSFVRLSFVCFSLFFSLFFFVVFSLLFLLFPLFFFVSIVGLFVGSFVGFSGGFVVGSFVSFFVGSFVVFFRWFFRWFFYCSFFCSFVFRCSAVFCCWFVSVSVRSCWILLVSRCNRVVTSRALWSSEVVCRSRRMRSKCVLHICVGFQWVPMSWCVECR